MSIRWFLMSAAVFLTTISVSCLRSGPGLYPVHGTVTYKGQPAEGAIVYFHQQGGGSGSPQGLIPTGVVDATGKFSLESGDLGSGAPAGKYAVLVQWPDDSVSLAKVAEANAKTSAAKEAEKLRARRMKLDRIPSNRLKGRYSATDRPLLTAEVKAETNNLPSFDLQDGPSPAEEKKERRASKVTEDRG
jgi:hypothetical protein